MVRLIWLWPSTSIRVRGATPRGQKDARRATPEIVKPDLPSLACFRIRLKSATRLRGSIGVPTRVVNTRPWSCQREPASRRFCVCRMRRARRAAATESGRLMARTLRALFGSTNSSSPASPPKRLPLIRTSDRDTVSERVSRSTSVQRRPNASPRRSPNATAAPCVG